MVFSVFLSITFSKVSFIGSHIVKSNKNIYFLKNKYTWWTTHKKYKFLLFYYCLTLVLYQIYSYIILPYSTNFNRLCIFSEL